MCRVARDNPPLQKEALDWLHQWNTPPAGEAGEEGEKRVWVDVGVVTTFSRLGINRIWFPMQLVVS